MFITFEGPEGSGKSTQAKLLHSYLLQRGLRAVLVREPGGTALGDKLRDILMFRIDIALSARAEALLFAAARAQLVDEVVRPHLAIGGVVICDRYADSTLAYQAYGRGLDVTSVRTIINFAINGLMPDLTFLLDVPPEIGLARNHNARGITDRFELEELEFHQRVRQGYLEIAKAEPDRWRVIDATGTIETVWQQVREVIERRLVR